MDGCSDAACDMVVDTVPSSVRWIADHDAAESLFAQLPSDFVKHLGKDNVPEDTEVRSIGRGGREEGERDASGGTNRATHRAVAEVQNSANRARPHEIGDKHAV
jgi:hypothetical protein